jgi:hypothetical protein
VTRNTQRFGVRREDEARLAHAQRRPRLAVGIEPAQHHERQLRIERAMLLRQIGADAARSAAIAAIAAAACARTHLGFEFAGVKRPVGTRLVKRKRRR